jgi:hypothetical protein
LNSVASGTTKLAGTATTRRPIIISLLTKMDRTR